VGVGRDTYKMQETDNELQKPPPVYCFCQSCLAWVRAASHGRPVQVNAPTGGASSVFSVAGSFSW